MSGLNHTCNLISDFFKNVILSTSSHMSTNINTILQYLNIKSSDLFHLNKGQIKRLFEDKSGKPDWRCDFIKELLYIRENQLLVDFDSSEVKEVLDYVSTFR